MWEDPKFRYSMQQEEPQTIIAPRGILCLHCHMASNEPKINKV